MRIGGGRGFGTPGRRALRVVAESCRDCPGQRRTAERLRCGWEEWAGIAAEIIPKMSSNAGQSLSHGRWPCQLPLHKGALGDGGCGLPRRPCGPPRNDKRFLSFRGAERRGNPSFLRWTGVRAAVPREWPPPTKFRTEIWGVGQVVGPYGTKRKPAATAGAALSEAESAERGAGQIRFLPDTLRVQHGVQGSEVCGKPRPCSR